MGNVFRILKVVYYMQKPEIITKKIKKNMSSKEFAEVISFLEKKGWINVTNIENPGPFHINLTDQGVQFLVNEISKKRQEEFNRIIAFTASILALIGIYDFFNKLEIISKANWVTWIFVIFAIVAIGPIITFIIKSYFGDRDN